ncbi:hypothetical protein X777_01587 [Ooceraea biroi]|uniref:Mos1 transposase HTH domain-containing protein n=1 Tax=Ooceraea biroi TaxID=2015173 RepID=A0A026WSZ9_OOCBI|nr:hypothetical protein X777_01587 [Ooceraea biroi]
MCREWFRRFKSGDYDPYDKQRSGQSKNLKIPNCNVCWMKTLLKHLKNWLNSSMLTSQQYPDVCMPWGRYRKKENGCHTS